MLTLRAAPTLPKCVHCEQSFPSCTAFSICEVVRVACLWRSWFVNKRRVNKSTTQLTSDSNDFSNPKSHARKKPLLGGWQMCCFANQSYRSALPIKALIARANALIC